MIKYNHKLRLAIMGGGINSAVGLAHISALRLTGTVTIDVAFFSRDKYVNEESAFSYGIQKSNLFYDFESFVKGISEKLPDLIVLLTPSDQHFQQLRLLYSLNIPVISEKSLTTSFERGLELVSNFDSYGIQNWVIYNYTGYPMLREAYTIFKKWNIDDVLSFKLQMPQSAFLKRDSNQILIRPQEWRCRDYEIPTISLDLGVHLYSIAQFFLGFHLNFVDIKARHSSSNQIENVIDDVTILAKLDSGIFMDLWFSKVAIGHLNGLSFSIFAKRGALHWNQEKPDILRVTDPDGTIKILKRGDFGLQVANQNRYTRFKGGHPTGFVEALTNYYLDIFHHYLNAKLGIQYFSESEVMPVFTFKSSLDGLNFFQSAFTKKIV